MYTGKFETRGHELLEVWRVADQFGVTNALKAIPVILEFSQCNMGPSH